MQNRTAKIFLIVVLIGAVNNLFSQSTKSDWSSFQFLIGEWVGEGSGAPGEAKGAFTFSYDLQNQILVRKNYAEYPAQNGRPAFRHDDLMIVYHEGNSTKAVYFDNEGHIINYAINFSKDSLATIFTSEPNPASPRFRFTYYKSGNEKMKFSFDIAPPGKPEEFSKYIDGVVKKKI